VTTANLDDLSLRQLDANSDGHKLMALDLFPQENVTAIYQHGEFANCMPDCPSEHTDLGEEIGSERTVGRQHRW
jgi:hypothetical protein